MALVINSVHSCIGNPCAIINNNNLLSKNIYKKVNKIVGIGWIG
jgi:hypothetical protein